MGAYPNAAFARKESQVQRRPIDVETELFGQTACLELGLEVSDSVLEASAVTNDGVHDGGVSLGSGVGDKHGVNE